MSLARSGARRVAARGPGGVRFVLAVMVAVASFAMVVTAPPASAATPGTGLAWGSNGSGELGNGTNTSSTTPVNVHSTTPVNVQLPAGTTITAIAAGFGHSLALTSTGAVLAWGYNANGQLGNGTNTDSTTPVNVQLPAGTTITAIAAGGFHSLALTSTGAVLAWGRNVSGELGNGTTTNSTTPVAVSAPATSGITAIAAGAFHSLAVTSTGAVLAWGRNVSGELGNGTNTDSTTPVAVSAPATGGITAIAAGDGHSLAVTSTGAVLAWGFNADGELGNGTTTDSNTPVAVSAPATRITAIAGGGQHSLATGRRR
jgi:alpha-tubulin suppressor-like RCC1 family protein